MLGTLGTVVPLTIVVAITVPGKGLVPVTVMVALKGPGVVPALNFTLNVLLGGTCCPVGADVT